ncbi:hypothetical protein Nepgr_007623 [Nepenthes gracilis]|uniref:glycerophosphodiester phosphodiesterase n=1 Tax=Nepenthes gracilis TaxID=150966 RepID=A0AAD3S7E7_NEPGR|nr:hypothetical protein Nepgr_007623 [Nepenthes gracilis]
MASRRHYPAMCRLRVAIVLLLVQFVALVSAQGSKWQTLDGSAPLVVAQGGFSGLFPDSSISAYDFANATSLSNVILWCDVQLTKEGAGICFPSLILDNGSDISSVLNVKQNTYVVNGVPLQGHFSIDFTLNDLANVTLTQGIYSRNPYFDNMFPIMTPEDVFSQVKPPGFWLNIQHDVFFSQHNLSHNDTEPSTNQTYGSLLKNLTFIKTFASGILVPKTYIWPVESLYLQPHTSVVSDAHKIGLEAFASDFANDFVIAYNYSYNPIAEYLSFIDNGNFSVDGVLSAFPVTPSEAIGCFAHIGRDASGQATPLVISHNGASGDYPGCTDIAYTSAISDGADVIDCNVQMSKDGIPFCLSSINLIDSTMVAQTVYGIHPTTIPELQKNAGIFTFSLTWSEIQGLTPAISNPESSYLLYRNPKFKNAGKLLSLSEFLSLAQNATTLSGVLIIIENAFYLAEHQGLGVTDAVLDALDKAGYNNIKSFSDAVLLTKKSVIPDDSGFTTNQTDIVSKLQSFKLQVYVKLFQNEFVSIDNDFFSDPTVEINSFVMGASINGVVTDFPQTAASYKSVRKENVKNYPLLQCNHVKWAAQFMSPGREAHDMYKAWEKVGNISLLENRCLKSKVQPSYMSPVLPGSLLPLLASGGTMPPVEAPAPVLTVSDVSEPPLSPAIPIFPAPAPAPAPPSPSASSPKTPTNGQSQTTVCAFVSWLSTATAALLLF